jgi:pimeloyl-ACP methyl ester carboxylesterase
MSVALTETTPTNRRSHAPVGGTEKSHLFVHRVGSGEPLVLLHGLGESSIGWRPVIDALAADHDVIAIDLPGFGRSRQLPALVPPTADNLAAAIRRTLDDLGVDDYHVAGYSLGARVAIHLTKSDRVRSVTAIAPDGLGTPLERVQGYLAMLAGRGVAIMLAPVAGPLSATPAGRSVFFSGNRSQPWKLPPRDARQLLTGYAQSPAYDAAAWVAMFDMPTHLHQITAPTLFLQGTADPLMTQQISRFVGSIPGAQLRWVPGAQHVPISDNPTAVADQMLTFLHDPSQ